MRTAREKSSDLDLVRSHLASARLTRGCGTFMFFLCLFFISRHFQCVQLDVLLCVFMYLLSTSICDDEGEKNKFVRGEQTL